MDWSGAAVPRMVAAWVGSSIQFLKLVKKLPTRKDPMKTVITCASTHSCSCAHTCSCCL